MSIVESIIDYKDTDIYKKIITIINKYTFIDDLLEVKDNYDDLSFEDVNITCTSDGLEGVEYQVIVSVTDSNNNSSQATFTYYINDTTPPSVTVRDTVYLEKGRKYTTDELFDADEIIVTSSSKMARGVKTIDGKRVGGKDENTLCLLRDTMYANYLIATNK